MSADNHNETIAIVDENGNVQKYVKRSELQDEYTWRIICVWVENSQGEVLLQQRSFKKRLGAGLWTCAVEGTVEWTDTYLQTARREVAEEIGLTEFTLLEANRVLYKSELGSRLAQGYTLRCDWPIDRFTPQPEEVEQLVWANRQETIQKIKAGHPDFPKSAKAWLEMFSIS